MAVKGLEGRSVDEINMELRNGAKFVIYEYCISVLIMTFKRGSDVYFIPAGKSRLGKGLVYSLISFLFGWWGIPWGPIYTIGSIFTNFSGGKDVTETIIKTVNSQSSN